MGICYKSELNVNWWSQHRPRLQKQIKDGGYKKKKKKSESVTRESIEEWYSDEETISLYQGRYGDEWLKKLNNTYEKDVIKTSLL